MSSRAKLEIVAHRGANGHCPENTFISAEFAISWGMQYVEVDVSRSYDGVLYCFHGPKVNRTTNIKDENVLFDQLTATAIDALDVGSWYNPLFAAQRPPRLIAFLQFMKLHNTKVFLDVKQGTPSELLHAVYETKMQDNCFFWSHHDAWAKELRRLDRNVAIKINAKTIDDVKRAKDVFQANIIEIRAPDFSSELLQTCRELGMKCMVFEPERDVASYLRIIHSEVDMVNLNHVDVFLTVLEQSQTQMVEKPVQRCLVGTDLDGTFGKKTTPLPPQVPILCISGRTWSEYDQRAKQVAAQMPLYIRGTGDVGDPQAAAFFKATMIKQLGVTHFCEDDQTQLVILRKECPSVVFCVVTK